jgi:hypothetical protein
MEMPRIRPIFWQFRSLALNVSIKFHPQRWLSRLHRSNNARYFHQKTHGNKAARAPQPQRAQRLSTKFGRMLLTLRLCSASPVQEAVNWTLPDLSPPHSAFALQQNIRSDDDEIQRKPSPEIERKFRICAVPLNSLPFALTDLVLESMTGDETVYWKYNFFLRVCSVMVFWEFVM